MTRRARVEEVLEFLGIESRELLRVMRREGLFESDELLPDEADDLRVAAVLMQEMGVNPAGVDVILHMRRRLIELQTRMEVMRRLLEEG